MQMRTFILPIALAIAALPLSSQADPNKDESGKGGKHEEQYGPAESRKYETEGRGNSMDATGILTTNGCVIDHVGIARHRTFAAGTRAWISPTGTTRRPANVGCGIRTGRPDSSRLRPTAVHWEACLATRG